MADRLNAYTNERTLAVISNPISGRNRRGALSKVAALCQRHGILHLAASSRTEVAQALATLAPTMPDVLAINSGDGTIDLVLDGLQDSGLPVPILALIGGGSTNMIHRDCGLRGSPPRALAKLLHWHMQPTAALPVVMRQPMLVTGSGTSVRHGFFLAIGAIPRVTAAVRQRLHPRGLIGRTCELATLLQTLWRLWRKRDLSRDPLLAPQSFAWLADDIQHVDSVIFFAATTLQRLLFKIETKAGPNAIGLLWMNAARKVSHGATIRLAFSAREDWVIDGEPQPPGDYQVSLATPIRLLSDV